MSKRVLKMNIESNNMILENLSTQDPIKNESCKKTGWDNVSQELLHYWIK